MNRIMATIFALAIVLMVGTLAATEAQADEGGAVSPFTGLIQQALETVEADASLQSLGQGWSLSSRHEPDSVVLTDAGTILATWNWRVGYEPHEFRLRLGDDLIARIPDPDGDGYDSQFSLVYTITAEWGFGPVVVEQSRVPAVWYWGFSCVWKDCDETGHGPFPPGDFRKHQSVGPWDFPARLKGCHAVLKPGNNEALVCVQPGWVEPED